MDNRKKYRKRWRNSQKRYEGPLQRFQGRFYSRQKPPVNRELIPIFAENLPPHTLGYTFEVFPFNQRENTTPKNKDFSRGLILWLQKTLSDRSMLELNRKKVRISMRDYIGIDGKSAILQ